MQSNQFGAWKWQLLEGASGLIASATERRRDAEAYIGGLFPNVEELRVGSQWLGTLIG